MKNLNTLKINENSKIYIYGIIISIIALFIITGCIFLFLISDKIDIVMSQPARETYTYFISIIDRVLLFITIFAITPLTIYQIISKEKDSLDKFISCFAIIILGIITVTFLCGEIYYFKKYTEGELVNSKLFNNTTIETKIFDKIINVTKK